MRGILSFIVVLGALFDTGHCASKYFRFVIESLDLEGLIPPHRGKAA